MDEKNTIVLTTREEQYALVTTNPKVQQIASRFRWRPETTIARIKRALPSVLEQQVYLAIAPETGESGILPESMAKLLDLYLGYQRLQLHDLTPGSAGRTRFTSFVEFLGECINMLKIVTKEYHAFSLRILDAGKIVLHYGKDQPERLVEMVDCNLEEMCEVLDISNSLSYSLRMRLCISVVVEKIIPENHRSGVPDLLDLADFLNMPSARRDNLRRVFQEEVPDYLSEDHRGLWNDEKVRRLVKEGFI